MAGTLQRCWMITGMLHQRFDGVEKLWKKLRKCTDVNEYRGIVHEIFHNLPMHEELQADW